MNDFTASAAKAEVQPLKSVAQLLGEQTELITVCQKLMHEFEKGLALVLVPVEESKNLQAIAPPHESPLHCSLRQNNEQLHFLISHIQSLPTRLHLQ